MGWKWNDAVGGAVDGAMTYGPYGAIYGGLVGGWAKDFDKGLTGNSRSGLVEKTYGYKNGNIGTKLAGNFSGDERDQQFTTDGNFDFGKSIGSAADLVSSYYGMKNGGNSFGSYNNPSGQNANISFGSGGGDYGGILNSFGSVGSQGSSGSGGYSGMIGSLLNSQGRGNTGNFEQGPMGQGTNSYQDIFKVFDQFQKQRNPTDTSDPNYNPIEHAGLIKSRYPFIPDQAFQNWLRSHPNGIQMGSPLRG